MKIGKALSEKKSAQNMLARLISLRDQTMYHLEGKEPEMEFSFLEDQIQERLKVILDLKLRIIITNCSSYLENGMLLQEAIIRSGDIRSELKSYNDLLNKDAEGRSYFHISNPKTKEYVSQISKKEVVRRIEELEAMKYQLDALISNANNSIDIIEKVSE